MRAESGPRHSVPVRFLAPLAAGVLVLAAPCLADPTLAPFTVGERLTYDLRWGVISAGTAVMEVAERQTVGVRSVLKVVHTAQSNDFISVFYPVNNRVESLLDEQGNYSTRLFFKRREGKRKNDIEVLFDQVAHRATVTKDGATETMDIPPEAQDTLSCLYLFRTLRTVDVGSSSFINVFHDKKNYRLEARIEGKERLKGPLGEFDTIRVLVIMPFRGLFLNEGNIRVWLTDDAARVPVLMKAKVVIGSVTATLASVNGITLTARP